MNGKTPIRVPVAAGIGRAFSASQSFPDSRNVPVAVNLTDDTVNVLMQHSTFAAASQQKTVSVSQSRKNFAVSSHKPWVVLSIVEMLLWGVSLTAASGTFAVFIFSVGLIAAGLTTLSAFVQVLTPVAKIARRFSVFAVAVVAFVAVFLVVREPEVVSSELIWMVVMGGLLAVYPLVSLLAPWRSKKTAASSFVDVSVLASAVSDIPRWWGNPGGENANVQIDSRVMPTYVKVASLLAGKYRDFRNMFVFHSTKCVLSGGHVSFEHVVVKGNTIYCVNVYPHPTETAIANFEVQLSAFRTKVKKLSPGSDVLGVFVVANDIPNVPDPANGVVFVAESRLGDLVELFEGSSDVIDAATVLTVFQLFVPDGYWASRQVMNLADFGARYGSVSEFGDDDAAGKRSSTAREIDDVTLEHLWKENFQHFEAEFKDF